MLSKPNQRTVKAQYEVTSQTRTVIADKPLKAEIAELRNISERLVHLAEDDPTVTETLLTIAASVSNSATILAVLLETKPNLGNTYKRTN